MNKGKTHAQIDQMP